METGELGRARWAPIWDKGNISWPPFTSCLRGLCELGIHLFFIQYPVLSPINHSFELFVHSFLEYIIPDLFRNGRTGCTVILVCIGQYGIRPSHRKPWSSGIGVMKVPHWGRSLNESQTVPVNFLTHTRPGSLCVELHDGLSGSW